MLAGSLCATCAACFISIGLDSRYFVSRLCHIGQRPCAADRTLRLHRQKETWSRPVVDELMNFSLSTTLFVSLFKLMKLIFVLLGTFVGRASWTVLYMTFNNTFL